MLTGVRSRSLLPVKKAGQGPTSRQRVPLTPRMKGTCLQLAMSQPREEVVGLQPLRHGSKPRRLARIGHESCGLLGRLEAFLLDIRAAGL